MYNIARVVTEFTEERPKYFYHATSLRNIPEARRLNILKCYRLTVEAMILLRDDGTVRLEVNVDKLEELYQTNGCDTYDYPITLLNVIRDNKSPSYVSPPNSLRRYKLHYLAIYMLTLFSVMESKAILPVKFKSTVAEHHREIDCGDILNPSSINRDFVLQELLKLRKRPSPSPAKEEENPGDASQWMETIAVLDRYLAKAHAYSGAPHRYGAVAFESLLRTQPGKHQLSLVQPDNNFRGDLRHHGIAMALSTYLQAPERLSL